MSDLVGNPKDRFSLNEAQLKVVKHVTSLPVKFICRRQFFINKDYSINLKILYTKWLKKTFCSYYISIFKSISFEYNFELEYGKTLWLNEPRYEKTGFLHMRKQRRRSASR